MFEIRPIMKDNNLSLRKKSLPVSFPMSEEDKKTAQYLIDYLMLISDDTNCEKYDVRAGVGLAAPQIGVNKRMIGIYLPTYDDEGKITKELKLVLINPKIVSHSERLAYLLAGEGCLSVDKDHAGYVYRYAFITVEAYNFLSNTMERIKLRGYEAIVLQHEIDHLDGILFYDRIDKNNPSKKVEGALEL